MRYRFVAFTSLVQLCHYLLCIVIETLMELCLGVVHLLELVCLVGDRAAEASLLG